MLSHLKLSAIAVGLLILVATSVVKLFVVAPSFAWVISIDSRPIAVGLILLLFAIHTAGYLVAG